MLCGEPLPQVFDWATFQQWASTAAKWMTTASREADRQAAAKQRAQSTGEGGRPHGW